MKRALAAVLAAALVVTAPGLACYAAAAEVVSAPAGSGAIRPVQIGTSQLNVLKGAGPLPVAPGALGIDPTQRTLPSLPGAQTPVPAAAAPQAQSQVPAAQALTPQQAKLDPVACVAQDVAPNLEAIAKPGASGEGSSRASEQITTALQGGKTSESGVAVEGQESPAAGSGLSTPSSHGVSSRPSVPPPAAPAAKKTGAKLKGLLISAGRVAAAAIAVVAIQAAAVALAPAVFGAVPAAAVWAVSSGVFLLPAAAYTRYRLAKHDSPALAKVKLALDVAIGVFAGAAVIAAPAFSLSLLTQFGGAAIPLGMASGAATFLSVAGGGKMLDVLAVGASMAGLPLLVGVGGAGALAVGPLLGLMALPVMTTLSFFLGSIVRSAETGRPFSVPGTLQKIRFPSFNWVMMGVVFALTSGYGAVLTNTAFAAWTLFGDKGNKDKLKPGELSMSERAVLTVLVKVLGERWAEKIYRSKPYAIAKKVLGFVLDFNVLYAGVLALAAASGFTSPLTFLVLAFAPERAAHWTERLLRSLYPGAKAAPSTESAPEQMMSLADKAAVKAPRFYHWAKTAAILALMVAVGFAMGATVFGFAALGKNLLVAAAIAAPQLIFSRWLVKKLMKAEPATPENMPKHYGVYSEVVAEVRGLVNARRAAKGLKPIPLPEKVRIPQDYLNAFATGPGPFHATIGVTDGIMDAFLDPRNAREGLVRLVESVAKEPEGKPYQVFRKAIAGTLPGISEGAQPQEAQQALLRASDEQIAALGRRMLRGVLGHEFSHVTDRHMLTGSISGALSSAVAFSSYGVMWGVGHAKAKFKQIFSRGSAPALGGEVSGARVEQVSGDGTKTPEERTELLDPVSTGVAIKSLPALLRVFAALWGPTMLQIVQMAGSRNNESQADKDGAFLTDDPESLALALGMLTTWRPKPGFAMEYAQLPRLAALGQFMTVDPIEQLRRAQVLPKDDALPPWAGAKGDDWMFDLWVTHPDTRLRIEILHDISESLHRTGAQDFSPQPPPSRESSVGLLSAVAPTDVGRGGLLSKLWSKLKDFIRVLPDKAHNREFWKFVWSQALINLGINFHYTALPKLVDPKDDQPQRVLYNRAVNSGSQLVSSMATGGMVDRFSVQKILVWSNLGRSLLLLAVPLLFHFGLLSFLAFQLIIFGAGFLQSTSMTGGSVAFNRILSDDTAYYNKANAVFNLIVSLVGIAGPLLAGSFIVLMDAHFGFLSGNAFAYGVYGVLMAAATWVTLKLRIPRDELLQARRGLWDALKARRPSFWRRLRAALAGVAVAVGGLLGLSRKSVPVAQEAVINSVNSARVSGKPILLVEVRGDPAQIKDVPAEFEGYPVKVVPLHSVWRELVEGFRLIFKDRFLKVYLLFGTVSALMADPIIFSALPRYIEGVLKIPAAQQGGVFGLYMAATGLGTGLASFLLMLFRDHSEPGFESALTVSKKKLSASGLSEEQAENATEAARQAKGAVLARYRERWRSDPAWRPEEPLFVQELLSETAAGINAKVFAGAKSQAELASFMNQAGLSPGLWAWSAKHFDAVARDARKQAASGLTMMERQGRWSSWLNGVGWLLYWGVFFLPGLHASLAMIVIGSMLQAPAMAIWSALVQHVLGTRYPENMGKIYSSINFYTLVFGILGPILFSPLVKFLPVFWVLVAACVAITITALFDFLQPGKSFPLDKGAGPKP